jgi:hypothetical protein
MYGFGGGTKPFRQSPDMPVLDDLVRQFPVKPRTGLFGVIREIILEPLYVIRFKFPHPLRLFFGRFIDAYICILRNAPAMFVVVI